MTAPRTEANGRIVPKQAQEQKKSGGAQSLAAMLTSTSMQAEIAKALPKHIPVDRIIRIATTALRVTRNLALCTPDSFLGCVLQAAQLGLEVNTPLGHAYLIPRKNGARSRAAGHDVYDCTMVIGYQGMIELANRSGKIDAIYAHAVREGDVFTYSLGLSPSLKHEPSSDSDRTNKPITHVYAVARIKGAEPVFEVLDRAQIEARMARGGNDSGTSPWLSDPEPMARKSGVRALFRWVPKSPELAAAINVDEAGEVGTPTVGFAPEVQEALSSLGMQPTDVVDERPEPEKRLENRPEIDPLTGETIPDGVGVGAKPGGDDEQ